MNKKLIGFSVVALLGTKMIAQSLEISKENVKSDSMNIQQLDEVVVSDSRFVIKRENSGKTVIQISAQELERYQGRTIAELINTKSGIEVNGARSYAGQNISVFARGGNNRQVLVVIDGIQVSDPSNVNAEYDLRMLNISQIESIEILKGAASTLYGNSAATAVINITTKKAKENGTALEVRSSLGTNQSQNKQDYNISDFSNSLQLMFKRDKLSVLANGGHQHTDGLSAAIGTEPDVFSRIDANVTLGYQFTDRFNIEMATYYHKMNTEFDNGYPIADADFLFNNETSRFSLSSTYNYKKGSLALRSAFNQIDRSFKSSFPSTYNSESLVFDIFNKYTINDKVHTIIGVNLIDHVTGFIDDENVMSVDPYINAVFIGNKGLNVNAGARLNNHSTYGNHLIYNINPSFRLRMQQGYIKLMGSYATSFIAPNLSQLYGPFGANPDLNPETNTTIEGGMEFRLSDNLRLSGVYFNRVEEDRITYMTIDQETFESQYRNLAEKVVLHGVEFELQLKPFENLTIATNYTYTDAQDGLALRIPKSKVNGSVGYTFSRNTYFSLAVQFVSERSDADFKTFSTIDLEPFTVLDFYAKHDFNNKFRLFASINNLFNEDYVELVDYTTLGRNVRIGFTLKL
ncbi:TonB-dependent receptor plug domain-containing protein [Maribacter sp. CXY002]|uniref:TonB-dependent receptor plug domain-containing protein n=1 Tax=Maribacter luteocoastalis TaxID=3407671 RepID=UPI003B66E10B